MKIVELNGYHLKLEPRIPLGNARTFIRTREFLALEIKTDAGITGWGEVFSSPWAAAALIRNGLARFALGQSPERYGRIFSDMVSVIGYDKRGPAMMAISAIDMALHDAAARARHISVADMLGGALRDRVFAYASGPFLRQGDAPYAHFNAEVEGYLARGFKAVKPRAGVSPSADGKMAQELRQLVGLDVGLMVDINQGYTAAAAISAAQCMAPAGLLWIEEPVQPEDVHGYAATARSTPTAIAGGEALGSLSAFRDFFQACALSIVQPDMTVCGGFSGFQRVAHLAAAYDLPVMPHVFSTAINFYASLQMAALLPARRGGGPAAYPFVEYDTTDNPLIGLFGFPVGADSHVDLPTGPGIGIDLTPTMLEPWITETWSLRSS